MKKQDVPQHGGLLSGNREVNYAVDADGQYTLEPSVGWDAKNTVLRQAWQEISKQLSKVIDEIREGKKSALAYHMVKNQMDPTLLSSYSGIARWKVKRHLKPAVFNTLDSKTLAAYAEVFSIKVDELQLVPDKPLVPPTESYQAEADEP